MSSESDDAKRRRISPEREGLAPRRREIAGGDLSTDLVPAWKSLVDQLVDDGYESPHLDRLRARYDVYQRRVLGRASLEVEILEEMAHALGRAEEKVDVALLELELAGRRCDRAGNDAPSVEAFNAARRRALAVRRDLQIHREALRFPRDPRFAETYPIPPARTSTG